MPARATLPRAACTAALAIAVLLAPRVAHAMPIVTVDSELGAGGSVRNGPLRFNFGLYANLLFGPPPTSANVTVPIGFYLLSEGDGNGNSYGSLGLSAAIFGAPSKTMTPFTISAGPLAGERDDGQTHPGLLLRGAWGFSGPQEWVYKALSLQLFVEDRAMLADGMLPADHQIVAGLQISPLTPLAIAFTAVFAGHE